MISSMVVPGTILLWECIIVSIATVSPESTVSLGGSFGSSQPHWTVSSVAARTWCLPPGAAPDCGPGACWAAASRPSEDTRPAAETRPSSVLGT
jgi:hypothetical protein